MQQVRLCLVTREVQVLLIGNPSEVLRYVQFYNIIYTSLHLELVKNIFLDVICGQNLATNHNPTICGSALI